MISLFYGLCMLQLVLGLPLVIKEQIVANLDWDTARNVRAVDVGFNVACNNNIALVEQAIVSQKFHELTQFIRNVAGQGHQIWQKEQIISKFDELFNDQNVHHTKEDIKMVEKIIIELAKSKPLMYGTIVSDIGAEFLARFSIRDGTGSKRLAINRAIISCLKIIGRSYITIYQNIRDHQYQSFKYCDYAPDVKKMFYDGMAENTKTSNPVNKNNRFIKLAFLAVDAILSRFEMDKIYAKMARYAGTVGYFESRNALYKKFWKECVPSENIEFMIDFFERTVFREDILPQIDQDVIKLILNDVLPINGKFQIKNLHLFRFVFNFEMILGHLRYTESNKLRICKLFKAFRYYRWISWNKIVKEMYDIKRIPRYLQRMHGETKVFCDIHDWAENQSYKPVARIRKEGPKKRPKNGTNCAVM